MVRLHKLLRATLSVNAQGKLVRPLFGSYMYVPNPTRSTVPVQETPSHSVSRLGGRDARSPSVPQHHIHSARSTLD